MTMKGRRSSYRQALVPPQGGFKRGKPRWVKHLVGPRVPYAAKPRLEGLVCYACYGRHNPSIDFTLSFKELQNIVQNNESLKEDERARVPPVVQTHQFL